MLAKAPAHIAHSILQHCMHMHDSTGPGILPRLMGLSSHNTSIKSVYHHSVAALKSYRAGQSTIQKCRSAEHQRCFKRRLHNMLWEHASSSVNCVPPVEDGSSIAANSANTGAAIHAEGCAHITVSTRCCLQTGQESAVNAFFGTESAMLGMSSGVVAKSGLRASSLTFRRLGQQAGEQPQLDLPIYSIWDNQAKLLSVFYILLTRNARRIRQQPRTQYHLLQQLKVAGLWHHRLRHSVQTSMWLCHPPGCHTVLAVSAGAP